MNQHPRICPTSICILNYKKLIVAGALLPFMSGCLGAEMKSNQASSNLRQLEVSFAACPEKAVKTRGGYHVFIGKTQGFSTSDSQMTVDAPGTSEVDGTITVKIPDLPTGTYYLKTQAYSDLVDPNTAKTAVSELSDEVTIDVQ